MHGSAPVGGQEVKLGKTRTGLIPKARIPRNELIPHPERTFTDR